MILRSSVVIRQVKKVGAVGKWAEWVVFNFSPSLDKETRPVSRPCDSGSWVPQVKPIKPNHLRGWDHGSKEETSKPPRIDTIESLDSWVAEKVTGCFSCKGLITK